MSKYQRISDDSHTRVKKESLQLSFDFIDWTTRDFFIHGLANTYYEKLFDCLATLKQSPINSITGQIHPSLAPKFINFRGKDSTATKKAFPDSLKQKLADLLRTETVDAADAVARAEETIFQAFEISLSKNYGRIHGFVHSNVFHVVWFDPAHNLFLGIDRTTNKPRKTRLDDEFATVKTCSPADMHALKERLIKLEKENTDLYEMLEAQTSPGKSVAATAVV